MATEKQHAAAVLAALNAALVPKAPAYDIDEIPKSRPQEYVEVTVTRRYGGTSRLSSQKGSTGWRITTRPVSQSSVDNARTSAAKVAAALEDVFLTIDGRRTTPVQFETAEVIGPDEGWFSGLSSWTYTH